MTRDYTDRMSELGNEELFAILQEEGDYQPEVVEAAVAELRRRHLSAQEWQALQDGWLLEDEKRRQKAERSFFQQAGRRGQGFLDRFNPFHREGLARDLLMIRVSTFFIFIIGLTTSFDLYLLPGFWASPVTVIYGLLPVLLVPAGLYFFNRRKRAGWILLTTWCALSLAAMLVSVLHAVFSSGFLFQAVQVDFSMIIVYLIGYSTTIYALNRRPVTGVFRISQDVQIWVLALPFVVTAAAFWILLF